MTRCSIISVNCSIPHVIPFTSFAIEVKQHQELLAEERREHRACQEAFQFERERREEADNLVGRLFELLEEAGGIADDLRIQLIPAKGVRVPSPLDCWPRWSTMGRVTALGGNESIVVNEVIELSNT